MDKYSGIKGLIRKDYELNDVRKPGSIINFSIKDLSNDTAHCISVVNFPTLEN